MPLSVPQIKKALKDRRLTYREVGERAGLDTSTIGANVKKIPGKRSSRARQAIADAIGLSVEEVFGEHLAQPRFDATPRSSHRNRAA